LSSQVQSPPRRSSTAPAPAPSYGRGALVVLLSTLAFLSGFGTSDEIPPAASANSIEPQTPPHVSSPPPSRPAPTAESSLNVSHLRAVDIDSLPLYRSETSPEGWSAPTSLTVVTKGAIKHGESLGMALGRQDIKASTVHLIAREMRPVFDFRHSQPGDRYRLGQDPDGVVLDFRYSVSQEKSYYLFWEGTRYVVREEHAELQPQLANVAGVVESSLYIAIRTLGEHSQLATDFAEIFAWSIDFSRNARPGDEFQILYERLYRIEDDGEQVYVKPGRILAARYRGSVGDHSVVYYEPENGRGAYYRPDGTSIERAFLVAPLEFSRISSAYSKARRHPILKVVRPHRGIDYAAAHGTPLWTVADGEVIFRGWAGASGNLVKVRHATGYVSYYAHLSRFEKGLRVGDRVTQKQVIGYVGSTGLATGPHVCFRVQRHGQYVNPLDIASPPAEAISGDHWTRFMTLRDVLLSDLGSTTLVVADEAL
jgi:murein DD-endopeptidase MepM/ murein hydrolase activator NlpD